ncbi:MAG: HNH endonuclease [Erysipelotrichaceae bacterium]
MKTENFKHWLINQGFVSPIDFISKISTIEKYYGNIDKIYDNNNCKDLLDAFSYSNKDKELNLQPKHLIPIKKYKNKNIFDTYMNTSQDYRSRLNRYIDFRKSEQNETSLYPDSAETSNCIEGAKTTIEVNKYERSSIARQKCIDINGCFCHICGIDFQKVYGEIGKDFIHVHHKIPLNRINNEYKVDPINDLIPVCPNCHAMLHRKINNKYYSVDELKNIFENKY